MGKIPIKFESDLTGFSSGLKKAFAGAAVAAAATGFVKLQQAIADATNQLMDASVRTGVAAETLNGLRLAAEGSGQSFSDMEAALRTLPKNMGDAAKGIGTAKDAFEMLGVEVTNTDGSLRDSDSVLKETINKLGGVAGESERAALASDIFGRSGTKLLQALGNNMGSLDAYVELSNKYGVDVGPKAAESAAQWQRQMALTKDVMRGAAQSVLDFGGDSADAFALFQSSIVYSAELVKGWAKTVMGYAKGVGEYWSLVFKGEFRQAFEVAKTTISDSGEALYDARKNADAAAQDFLTLADTLNRVATTSGSAATQTSAFAAATREANAAVNEGIDDRAALFDQLNEIELATRRANAEDLVIFDLEREIEAAEAIKAELWDVEGVKEQVDRRVAQLNDQITEHRKESYAEEMKRVKEESDKRRELSEAELAMAEARAEAEMELTLGVVSAWGQVIGAAFGESKAGAIAEAMINTYVAVSKALTAAPPPFNAAFASAALALGMAQVAKIQSTDIEAHSGLARAPDEYSMTLTKPERVLSSRGVAAVGGDAAVAQLNQGMGLHGLQVVMQYRHKSYERFMYDNLRRDGTVKREIRAIAKSRGSVGHRSRGGR